VAAVKAVKDNKRKVGRAKPSSSPPSKGYCKLQKPPKDSDNGKDDSSKSTDNDKNGRPRRSVKNNKNNGRHSCQKPVKVCEDYDFKWGIIC